MVFFIIDHLIAFLIRKSLLKNVDWVISKERFVILIDIVNFNQPCKSGALADNCDYKQYTIITHLIGSYCKIFPIAEGNILQYDPIKCVIIVLLHPSP